MLYLKRMDTALKNSHHTKVFSTVPCVCTPLCLLSAICTFFLCHISLFSYSSDIVCYSTFPLIFLLSILKSCFGGCAPFHIFSFCSLPLSVGHLIFLLESLVDHFSKSCYAGGVLIFFGLANIIYQWWVTAKKICCFCSPFLASISSSKYMECWLFLKVLNVPFCSALQTWKPFHLSAAISASLIMETACLHKSAHLII